MEISFERNLDFRGCVVSRLDECVYRDVKVRVTGEGVGLMVVRL